MWHKSWCSVHFAVQMQPLNSYLSSATEKNTAQCTPPCTQKHTICSKLCSGHYIRHARVHWRPLYRRGILDVFDRHCYLSLPTKMLTNTNTHKHSNVKFSLHLTALCWCTEAHFTQEEFLMYTITIATSSLWCAEAHFTQQEFHYLFHYNCSPGHFNL